LSRPGPGHRSKPVRIFKGENLDQLLEQLLTSDTELSNFIINSIFTKGDLKDELSNKKSAYRRIHEHYAAVLDRAVEILRGKAAIDDQTRQEIVRDLTRIIIMVKYQAARGQLTEGIQQDLISLTNKLIKKTTEPSAQPKLLSSMFERARMIIDSLVIMTLQ
jgi:hypothetical protein